ncbi:type II toxin-antitoxin system HicA family toxin [Aeromonas veronii]
MGKQDKLLSRLHSKPKDFTWQEATSLLRGLGYELFNGKGSRRRFVHTETKAVINLHEPHPSSILKEYMVDIIIEHLRGLGEDNEQQ